LTLTLTDCFENLRKLSDERGKGVEKLKNVYEEEREERVSI